MNVNAIAMFAALSSAPVLAAPPIEPGTLVTPQGVVFWNVKTTGAQRDGSTTEQRGVIDVVRPEKLQAGSVCHNFAQTCVCTPVTFRIAPSIESQWHVLTKAGGALAQSREAAAAKREAIRAAKRAPVNRRACSQR